MKKQDVQELYRRIKREKQSRRNHPKTLFDSAKKSGGCSSCGKVTWKPYNQA